MLNQANLKFIQLIKGDLILDYQNDYNELLNLMYGIYGFTHPEDELKAKTLIKHLDSTLSREDLDKIKALCQIAYNTGKSDFKHQISEYLNKQRIS